MSSVLELIEHANQEKPADFKEAFEQVMQEKIAEAIALKKQEILDQINGVETVDEGKVSVCEEEKA